MYDYLLFPENGTLMVMWGMICRLVVNTIFKGTIFCHVFKINAFSQESASFTLGNQKRKDAEPLFNKREEKIIISIKKLDLILFEFSPRTIQLCGIYSSYVLIVDD